MFSSSPKIKVSLSSLATINKSNTSSLGLIDRLQTAAENTLLLAQDKTGSHQAYECILQMAFYYQAAWALAKRYQLADYCPAIIEQLKNLEQVFPKLAFEVASSHDEKQVIIQDFQLHYQNNNPHKKELTAIRDFAKKQLKSYQEQYNNSDLKMMTSGAAPKSVSMQAIYSDISQKIRTLFTAIISESILQYQQLTSVYPPCAYSFFALGSLAREEITPYSDIEFGVLIEDKLDSSINNKNKIYFRNLCRLINFKLLALAETPANFINKEFGEKINDLLGAEKHALIPNGFCFDAFVAGGYKNPLGKRDEKGELIFELIGTPSELADFQDEKHYTEKGKLVSEPLLPGSLTQARLIISNQTNEQLLKQYHQKVSAYLNQPAKQLWGKSLDLSLNLTLYQARALELLVADIGRFRPKLGKQEEDGRSFAAKHDLYRLPNMMFDQLALYFNLTQTNLWEQLNALAHSTTAARPALFNATATKNLNRAIDQVTEYRLATYLALEEQAESVELTDDSEKAMTVSTTSNSNDLTQKVFYLPKEPVFDLYRTLIPFWHAMRGFRDSKGQDINGFNNPVFGDFYTKALWIEANMQLLLQGHPQVLALLQPTIKTIIADEKADKHSQAFTLYIAGQAYLESNAALEEAKNCLARALAIFQTDNNKICSAEIINCYLGIAWINWLQQNSESAKSHHANGLQLVQTQFGERHPYYAEYQYLASYLQQKPGQLPNLKLPERIGNWHIPPDNKHFIGRTETLKKLTAHFKPAQAGMKLCFLSTISGLGGIGKTQVALKFLHHSGHDYALRLWFRAEQENTLLQDYIELAERFRLMAMGEKLSKNEIIARVKKHLENNPDWLAVYDNAIDYASIKSFLPTRGGHVVITTRRSKESLAKELQDQKSIDATTLEIDKFTLDEALQYLKEMTERSGVQEEQAMRELAKELDYLPLALAQAAAYIKRRGITTQDYRERYKTSQQYLLKDKLLPADSHSLPVATTWEVTLQAIQEEEQKAGEPPLALAVLQAMSYLYADQIPQNLLAQWFKVTRLISEKEIQNELKRVLDCLAAYSMIQKNDSSNKIENTVSIHRLVQEVIRNRSLQQQVPSNVQLRPVSKRVAASDNKNDSKIAVLSQPRSEEEKKKEQDKGIALDKALHLKQQSKIIYQQGKQNDFKSAEQSLYKAIEIYQQYRDSYAAELCDAFLDLALLLYVQGTQQSKKAAQKCLADAKQFLVKSYGKADAKQSRCKAVEWYLDAKRDNSIFAVKTYASFDTWQLPANNDEFFVGRESLVEKLNQHCKPESAYQMLVLSAVSGLGGVGKTQLAIYYLYHAKHQYNLRAWFHAENATLLLADYRNFAKEFNLIAVDEKTPKEEIIAAVKRYLERHPDWLAIYDNAGSRDEIREFLPTKGGHLIVTTRRQEYDDVGIKVAVDVFTEQEAIAYLKKLTGINNQEKEMVELAKTLGCLPLALGQAGMYIKEQMKKQSFTIQDYLHSFKQSAAKLLEAQQLTLDDRSETIATTWNISLKAIEQKEETNGEPHLSLPVLQAMAHLHAEDIPRNILEEWLQEQKLVADSRSAQLALDKVIGHLSDYSLIHVDSNRKMVSIHRLVQQVIKQKNTLTPHILYTLNLDGGIQHTKQEEFLLKSLVIALSKEFNVDLHDADPIIFSRQLVLHVLFFIEQMENINKLEWCLVLLEKIINYYLNYKQNITDIDVVSFCKKMLRIRGVFFEKNDLIVVKIFNQIGEAYYYKGDYKEAMSYFDKALKVLGRCDLKNNEVQLELANILNLQGDVYGKEANYRDAERLQRRALETAEVIDKNSALTAEIWHSLGNSLYFLEKYDEAAKSFEQSLLIRKVAYKTDNTNNPKIARTLHMQGLVKFKQALKNPKESRSEALKEAKLLVDRALQIERYFHGDSPHADVAKALRTLSEIFLATEDYKNAQQHCEQALYIQQKLYPENNHPQIARTLVFLGKIYKEGGQIELAKEKFSMAYKIFLIKLSPQHPDAINCKTFLDGDNKLSLAALTVGVSAVFSPAATVVTLANAQALNSASATGSDNKDAKVDAKVDGDKKSAVRR